MKAFFYVLFAVILIQGIPTAMIFQAARAIPIQHRTLAPWAIWLLMVPVAAEVVGFLIPLRVARVIQTGLSRYGEGSVRAGEDWAWGLAATLLIRWVAFLLLGIPGLSLGFGIPVGAGRPMLGLVLILQIICHWTLAVQVHRASKKLTVAMRPPGWTGLPGREPRLSRSQKVGFFEMLTVKHPRPSTPLSESSSTGSDATSRQTDRTRKQEHAKLKRKLRAQEKQEKRAQKARQLECEIEEMKDRLDESKD